jgi:hypothetical protein
MGDAVVVPAVSWLSKHLLVPLALECRGAGPELRGGANHFSQSEGLLSSRRTAEELAERWQQNSAVYKEPTGAAESGS